MGVIIGMDPHKRSATIEVIDAAGRVLEVGRFGTDRAGYAAMLGAGRAHGTPADRVWAVEGCNGTGRHIAHRLVHDGSPRHAPRPSLTATGRRGSRPGS